jgi:clan AA aspartic protease (TIGR02281 family)
MSRAIHVLIAVTLALCAAPLGAAINCKLMQIADWMVKPHSGKLIVDGEINGQKIGVLLDTGAQGSVILRTAADRLGLTRHTASGYRAYGVGGESYAEYAVLDEMKLGQAVRRNWRVLVVGERDLGADYAFLLGYDFFEQVDLEFDLPNDRVRLFQAEDCGNLSLAYWAKGTADVVRLEADHDKPGILVPVTLNGRTLLAELDSGTSRSVVSRLVAAQLGVTPQTPGTRTAGTVGGIGAGRADQWISAFQSFAIGGELIRNPEIRFTDLSIATTQTGSRLAVRQDLRDMLLGLDFLRAHRVYVAHSQGKLYFTYSGGPVFSTPPRELAKPAPKPDI